MSAVNVRRDELKVPGTCLYSQLPTKDTDAFVDAEPGVTVVDRSSGPSQAHVEAGDSTREIEAEMSLQCEKYNAALYQHCQDWEMAMAMRNSTAHLVTTRGYVRHVHGGIEGAQVRRLGLR